MELCICNKSKKKNAAFTSKVVSGTPDLWLVLVDPSSLGSPQTEVGLC